jgi:hypothetical protein
VKVLLPFSVFLLIAVNVHAQWELNGVAVSSTFGSQSQTRIIADGSGGAILVWMDERNGVPDIFAQKIDSGGVPQWTVDGVPICQASDFQSEPTLTSDGAGGAIIVWWDFRGGANNDIYAQRIDGAGNVQWTVDGIPIATGFGNQIYSSIVSDGAGGAIIAWSHSSGVGGYDIYAQRVDGTGAEQWTPGGVALCEELGDQIETKIVSDGSGGAIVAWEDYRFGTADVFARRVDSGGTPQWAIGGVTVSAAANDQAGVTAVEDGSGGAIIAWDDTRFGDADIYVQRVNGSGNMQWTSYGVALCGAAGDQTDPTICKDASNGAIIAWMDHRAADYDVYVRRISDAGATQWAADGIPVCMNGADQGAPAIVPDGSGGAVIAWADYRDGQSDIYAQRMSASGLPKWEAAGVAVSAAPGDQFTPVITTDGSNGGAIIAWDDNRNEHGDVFAQRIEERYGYWGHPEPTLAAVEDVPADQGGTVAVNWAASPLDVLNEGIVSYYSIWRATDSAAAAAAQSRGELVEDLAAITADFAGPAVWIEQLSGSSYYWEWIGNQYAHYLPSYTYTAPTRSDSTVAGISDHYFFVSAHTADPYVFFDSNVLAGHSVDNLAPSAPLLLTAQRVGSDVHLQWNSVPVSDLKEYALYRATSSGVTPVPANYLASEMDTVLVDANAPPSALFYIVTALDVHLNESDPSNEASVSTVTGVGGTPALTSLTVRQNYPNPFSGSTALDVGLPAASPVRLEVYDVAGRRVWEMETAGTAGWQTIPLTGLGGAGRRLANGVYFCRVSALGAEVTRKMVIAR